MFRCSINSFHLLTGFQQENRNSSAIPKMLLAWRGRIYEMCMCKDGVGFERKTAVATPTAPTASSEINLRRFRREGVCGTLAGLFGVVVSEGKRLVRSSCVFSMDWSSCDLCTTMTPFKIPSFTSRQTGSEIECPFIAICYTWWSRTVRVVVGSSCFFLLPDFLNSTLGNRYRDRVPPDSDLLHLRF